MNWDTYLVPYGKDITAAVYALNFAARSAMTFGGVEPGNMKAARDILLYNKERVFAFVLALGTDKNAETPEQLITDEKYATAAGAKGETFAAIAHGDLNGDGVLSTFQLAGAIDQGSEGGLMVKLAPNMDEILADE